MSKVEPTATSTLLIRRANRKTPNRVKALIVSMAVLVTRGAKWKHFHQTASQAITKGGWALLRVEAGIGSPGQPKIVRCRNKITGLIPKIRKPQPRSVEQPKSAEDQDEKKQVQATCVRRCVPFPHFRLIH